MPRISRSEENKKKILDAVGRAIHASSDSNITVRKIAADAGVALGSINYYFKSMTEMLIAFYARMMDDYDELYRAWINEIDPSISTFDEFFASFVHFMLSCDLYEQSHTFSIPYLNFYGVLSRYPQVREYITQRYAHSAALLIEAARKTRLQCENPHRLAYVFNGIYEGFSVIAELSPADIDRPSQLEYMLSCLHGKC